MRYASVHLASTIHQKRSDSAAAHALVPMKCRAFADEGRREEHHQNRNPSTEENVRTILVSWYRKLHRSAAAARTRGFRFSEDDF